MFLFSCSTSNLDDLVKGIKMIAALMDNQDSSKKLIDAAKQLAQSFSDLLNALNPNAEDKVFNCIFQYRVLKSCVYRDRQ